LTNTVKRLGLLSSTCVGTALFLGPQSLAQDARLRTLVYEPAQRDWLEQAPPPAGTPAGELYAIRKSIKDGAYRQALSELDRFVKQHGTEHELYPDSLVLRAQALVGRKKFQEAHEVLQTFLAEFRGMDLTAEALRLEFVVAEAFLAGAKRRFLWVFWIRDVEFGYKIFDEISTQYRDSPLAELALKRKGDHLASVGDHDLAEIEYARMLRDYPQSRYRQYALARTAQSALASFGGIPYDEAALIEAEERYRDYAAQFPAAAAGEGVGLVLDTIRESKAEKEFQIGQYYEKTDHAASAVFCYRLVLANYADTIAAAKAHERLELIGVPVEAPPEPGQPVPVPAP
jgi:outer membrane protein assembly factor BamD (BamD/ComL family)